MQFRDRVQELKSEGPLSFLFGFERESLIEGDVLKHFHSRLKALLLALQITDLESLTPLTLVADFCTLIGTYWCATNYVQFHGGIQRAIIFHGVTVPLSMLLHAPEPFKSSAAESSRCTSCVCVQGWIYCNC